MTIMDHEPKPIIPEQTGEPAGEPIDSPLDTSPVAPLGAADETAQPAAEQTVTESEPVEAVTTAGTTPPEAPVEPATDQQEPAKKFWTRPKKIAAAVFALVGVGVGGGVAATSGGGKSSPKPVAAHSTSSAPKPTASPSEQTTTTTPNTPTSSPTSTEISKGGESNGPHTYKLDPETYAALGWDPQLGEPTHGGAITAHDITVLQDKVADMNKYGLLDLASSDDPRVALKADHLAVKAAYDHNDPEIAAAMTWEPGGKYGQDTVQWMTDALSHKAPGLQLEYGYAAPKDIGPNGSYMYGTKNFSDLATPPYYKVVKDGDNWTAQVALHDAIMLSSPTDFNAGGVLDNDDKVYTMQRIGVTDETGKHSYVWIINEEDSYQIDNGSN